ncbi:MAG: hypothetical protein QNJ47_05415 [Nostocaceae cyanobacterium]|nr:hypothetical protein [Nostocaceae cyanobacterium]
MGSFRVTQNEHSGLLQSHTSQIQDIFQQVEEQSEIDQNHAFRLRNLEQRPQWIEEWVTIEGVTDRIFSRTLVHGYIETPIVTWFMLMGDKYVEINKQDSQCNNVGNQTVITCAFAGNPTNGQFRLSVQGLALPTTQTE